MSSPRALAWSRVVFRMLQRWIRTGRLRGCQGTKFGGKIASVFLEGTVELDTLATPRVAAAVAVAPTCCRQGR